MLRMAAERYPKWKAQRDRIDERERQELEKERQRRESLRSKERSLQDQDRELAISNPDVWRIYHSERISEREVPYDHVAYLPPQNGIPGYFLYLQEPELAPKTPTIQAVGDSREGRTIGPREKTRITITTEDGKNLGRFTLRGDYIRALGRGKYARFEGILTQALTLPIPGDDLGSVRKILAVYVEDLDDDEVRSMEEKILKHYNKLQSDQDRGKFLRFLRSNINRETSDEKKPDQWHHLTSKKLGAALSETLRYIGR